MPQPRCLKINGYKIKTNDMIKMQLMWIKSHALGSKMTTVQEVNLKHWRISEYPGTQIFTLTA
jgi:hypothetical protein